MTRPRIRTMTAVCGLLLVLLAAACGGGTSRARVEPDATTVPAVDAAASTSTVGSTAKGSASTTTPTTAATGASSTIPAATTAPTTPVTGSGSPVDSGGGHTPPPAPPPTSAPPPVCHPVRYDPAKPINLCGTPGVTPAEQARAEQLIRDTLRDIPRYTHPADAYNAGYRSIRDGGTGDEHYVKWAYSNDGRILDSKHPESLVYEWRNGVQTLVAAMYAMPFRTRFTDVPDVGGPLTQWHVHNDLCLAGNPNDPLQKVVSSLVGVNGKCPAGTSKAGSTPMLHVWIVPQKCGPFAALSGVGGGQIPPGEDRLCDRLHGSP